MPLIPDARRPRADICIPRILADEGGFVDHPSDPGGPTNKGITLATFRAHIKPAGTVADLRALTVAQAVVVYKREYWDAVLADRLPIGVDYAMADFAVHSGPSRATKYLQAVVGVAQDGAIGPKTLAAVDAMSPDVVVGRLCNDRLAFLRRLKMWPTFGKGWARRVEGVRAAALADISAWHPAPPPVDHVAAPPPGGAPQSSLTIALRALMRLFKGA